MDRMITTVNYITTISILALLGGCSDDTDADSYTIEGPADEVADEYVDAYVNGYNQGLINSYNLGLNGTLTPWSLGKPLEVDKNDASLAQLLILEQLEKEGRQLITTEDKIMYLCQSQGGAIASMGADSNLSAFRQGVRDSAAGKNPAHYVDFGPLDPGFTRDNVLRGFQTSTEQMQRDYRAGNLPNEVMSYLKKKSEIMGLPIEQLIYIETLNRSYKMIMGEELLNF
jgi:hypothetical protein